MKKVQVIINEQHTLLIEQKEILDRVFDAWEEYKVPSDGWNLKTIREKSIALASTSEAVVFASPIPAMIKILAGHESENFSVFVFHNDKREKKELPNGKIISVTAQTGWQLV